jgi:hypothetical protein
MGLDFSYVLCFRREHVLEALGLLVATGKLDRTERRRPPPRRR